MNKDEYVITSLTSERIKKIINEKTQNNIVSLSEIPIRIVKRKEWLN